MSNFQLVSILISGMAGSFLFIMRILSKKKNVKFIYDALKSKSLARIYDKGLIASLKFLKKYFSHPLSARAFGASVSLSLMYGLIFYIGSWIFGGDGKLGETVLLPIKSELWEKISFLAILVLASQITLKACREFGYILLDNVELKQKIKKGLLKTASCAASCSFLVLFINWVLTENLLETLINASATAVLIFVIAAGAGFSIITRPWTIKVIGKGLKTQIVSLALVGLTTSLAMASSGMILSLIAINESFGVPFFFMISATGGLLYSLREHSVSGTAGALIITSTGGFITIFLFIFGKWFPGGGLISLLLFFTVFPLINALWDLISWGISRQFAARLLFGRKSRTLNKILVYLSFDLAFAFFLLLGLLSTLTFVILSLNILLSKLQIIVAPLDILTIIDSTTINPWSPNGAWLTLMLITTIIPTASHFLLLSIGGIATFLSGEKLTNFLQFDNDINIHDFKKIVLAFYVLVVFLLGLIVLWATWEAILFVFSNKLVAISRIIGTSAHRTNSFVNYLYNLP